ncbi:aminotransferase class V-fold PLP-dependent enzyme [Pseudomonas rhizoryzae]|uniref:aminotransferase class V-fold PLP-dependent enzyme n=1 Tax=Pseudomonas rhizoryzae TaxID=2571129 RepID=UPI0007371D79|nr:aminotransferase class V-fold PLP-dependent enzyme [Pseudomonas rhizoryzae]KTT30257.1 class V aminotransferase [Pseudomonas psychrotolerans]KTT33582.1 class V aminotransferase [Pseudomonas psychrotolerans]KTT78749.1 class V aminotransferase [Pseudomonas psychrotolerans]
MDALPLYFDYAATTPVDDAVIEAMLGCLGRQSVFGNPASRGHAFGNDAQRAVDKARQEVAKLVGAQPGQLIWTSGATESNNLALLGVARRRGKGHLITSCLEHRAILDTAAQLEAEGFAVTYLTPNEQGLITADAVAQAWRDDTFLVSLMRVNNELGTLTDIAEIGTLVRARGALFHVDAAQATGKVAIDLARLDVDLMSFSAHKTYGPKGIGALYVGPHAEGALQAQIHGGGHERGLRSGTLATHQIVGMGTAFVLAGQAMVRENARLTALRDRFLAGVQGLPGTRLNGCAQQRIPHTLNLTFATALDTVALQRQLAFSTTSACSSAKAAPSHVLLGLGLDADQAARSYRFSLGRYTTEQDVDQAIALIQTHTAQPKPFWA